MSTTAALPAVWRKPVCVAPMCQRAATWERYLPPAPYRDAVGVEHMSNGTSALYCQRHYRLFSAKEDQSGSV